jgi:predicted transcriptional regulator
MDGRWFHQALERVNATQADLARHLRLAPSAVSRMIKGERQMKQIETVQIAEFLSVSPEESVASCLREPVSAIGDSGNFGPAS